MNLHCGDCLDVMRELADNSVDLVLTDPPYGLSFMGKKWDYDVPSVEIWAEALRVLKPGGHLLAFAGTRTQHRMACRIEDAGFEIRDMLAWLYGSGFPKSLDVSKAIDKAAGAEREVVGSWKPTGTAPPSIHGSHSAAKTTSDCGYEPDIEARINITAPATDAAREWAGYGTALKPALEPITMARKPLVGTVAANVLEYGTGALNIDACRVEGAPSGLKPYVRSTTPQVYALGMAKAGRDVTFTDHPSGRWPANLIHDGSEEATAPLAAAARYFYCAKASKRERDAGCEGMAARMSMRYGERAQGPLPQQKPSKPVAQKNHHPTVKPIALMEHLVKLASRPAAIVLDPFMGSGTTGIACKNLGRDFIGIERDPEYFQIARNRIQHTPKQLEIPA